MHVVIVSFHYGHSHVKGFLVLIHVNDFLFLCRVLQLFLSLLICDILAHTALLFYHLLNTGGRFGTSTVQIRNIRDTSNEIAGLVSFVSGVC